MKKTYIRPEMELMEFLGTDTICHASIYASDGTTPQDVVQDNEGDDSWTLPTGPIWID